MRKITILAALVFIFALATPSFAARLPSVGSDTDTWGTVLNEYLQVEHGINGTHHNITSDNINASNLFVSGVNISSVLAANSSYLNTIASFLASNSTYQNLIAANLAANSTRLDAIFARQAADNATITANSISLNNENTFSARWNFFNNASFTQLNFTDLFWQGLNLTNYIVANNATIANAFTAKANQSDLAANSTRLDTTVSNLAANSTYQNAIASNLAANSTYQNTIASNLAANSTRLDSTATNLSALHTLVYQSGGGNVTSTAGFLNTLAVFSTVTNLVSSMLFINGSTFTIQYPFTNLTGSLSVMGINVTGQQIADNATQSTQISSLTTLEAANNATQEALMLTRDSAKANQSDLAANSTRLDTAAFLASENTFTARWNFFNNASFRQLNFTDLFWQGINFTNYIVSNNATIAANLTSLNDRINDEVTLQAANNATQSAQISALTTLEAANNATQETLMLTRDSAKANQSDLAANSTRLDTAVSNIAANSTYQNTIASNLASNSTYQNTIASNLASNSTYQNTIASDLAANSTRLDLIYTREAADNATQEANISALHALVYTRSGNVTSLAPDRFLNSIPFFSTVTNLVSSWLYINGSTFTIQYPFTNLTGSLFVMDINVTGQQIADNATQGTQINLRANNSDLVNNATWAAANNATIAANLTSFNDRVNNEVTLQAANNATQLALINANNATLTDVLSGKANLTSFNESGIRRQSSANVSSSAAPTTRINVSILGCPKYVNLVGTFEPNETAVLQVFINGNEGNNYAVARTINSTLSSSTGSNMSFEEGETNLNRTLSLQLFNYNQQKTFGIFRMSNHYSDLIAPQTITGSASYNVHECISYIEFNWSTRTTGFLNQSFVIVTSQNV